MEIVPNNKQETKMNTRKVKKVLKITIGEFVRMANSLKADERLFFCESLDESDIEGIGWHSVTRLNNDNESILLIRYQGYTDRAMCLYGQASKLDIINYLAFNDFSDENSIYVELEVEEEVKKYKVEYKVTKTCTVEVEATNENEAREIAEEKWCNFEDTDWKEYEEVNYVDCKCLASNEDKKEV